MKEITMKHVVEFTVVYHKGYYTQSGADSANTIKMVKSACCRMFPSIVGRGETAKRILPLQKCVYVTSVKDVGNDRIWTVEVSGVETVNRTVEQIQDETGLCYEEFSELQLARTFFTKHYSKTIYY